MEKEKNKDNKTKELVINNNVVINYNKIYKKYPNRYLISKCVATRARQLQEGMKPYIEGIQLDKPFNFIDIALKELELDLIKIEKIDQNIEKNSIISELDENLENELEKKEEKESTKDKKKDKKKSKFKSLAA